MTEIAKMNEERIAEFLRQKGWWVQETDGVVSAAKDVSLTRTYGFESFRAYGRSRSDAWFDPTHAGVRLNLSERTAEYFLYEGDPPIGVVAFEECDFEGAVKMDSEEAGEMPLQSLIKGDGGLELVRAGFWQCDLFDVSPGEYFIRKDLSGGVEPRGADACYFRVPAGVAGELLELRLPLGLPGEDPHSRMASVVAALEEQGGVVTRTTRPIRNTGDFRAFVGGRAVSEMPGAELILDVLDRNAEDLGKAYIVPVSHGDSDLRAGGKDRQPNDPSRRSRIYATIYDGEGAGIAHSLDAVYHSREAALLAMHNFHDDEQWRHKNVLVFEKEDDDPDKDIIVDWLGPSMSARGTLSPCVFLYKDRFGGLYIAREGAPSLLAGVKSRIGQATFAEDAAKMLEGGVEAWDVDDWYDFEDFLPWKLREAYAGPGFPSHVATYEGDTDKVTFHEALSEAAAAYIGVNPYGTGYGYERTDFPIPRG